MKKILSVVLTGLLVLALTACSGGGGKVLTMAPADQADESAA